MGKESNMRVGEVMTAPVQTVAATAPASAAWEQMQLNRIGHLVVVDSQRRARGVVSDADLGGPHGAEQRERVRVGDVMLDKLVVASPATTIREAANLMRGHRVNCLLVFDRGRLVGVVTALDLLELVGRGVERPVAHADRPILKHRGLRPQGTVRAKRVHRSRLEKTARGVH
jgi:acetoin utilization protein AcuB